LRISKNMSYYPSDDINAKEITIVQRKQFLFPPWEFHCQGGMTTGMEVDCVMQGLAILEHQIRTRGRMLNQVADYNKPNVSEKVARIILSYTDYVKRFGWPKS